MNDNAVDDLLAACDRQLILLRHMLVEMKTGQWGTYTLRDGKQVDTTPESIAETEAMIVDLETVLKTWGAPARQARGAGPAVPQSQRRAGALPSAASRARSATNGPAASRHPCLVMPWSAVSQPFAQSRPLYLVLWKRRSPLGRGASAPRVCEH
jgi:hypothetical protein